MLNQVDLERVGFEKFIHLTTKGRATGKRHTVELWFAAKNSDVYLSHEGAETDWMRNIKQSGQVSFEIGGLTFNGHARYLEDGTDEAWKGKLALYGKYYGKATREVIEDWFSLSTVIVIETS